MKCSHHRNMVLLVAVLATACIAGATAGEAGAAFPGSDGKIVFRTNRDGNAEIYTMNPDGTNRVDLTRNPAEDVDPRWSPDGRRIVFASNRTGNYDIYTMRADGSDLRRLTFTTADNHRPSWTADGRILFHTNRDGNREIYVMNADGSSQTDVTRSPSDDAYAAASPHGDKLVYTSDRGGDYHLYLTRLDGRHSPVQQVTTAAGGEDFEANWSPSGNDLVFVRFDATYGSSDLYVVHTNGRGLTQLTDTPGRMEFEPAWSPDGRKIVFHACSGLGTDSQHCANYEMNAQGTGETEVSTPTVPYLDTFGGDRIDPFWTTNVQGSGTSVAETNGRLEITVPREATNDPALGYSDNGVFMQCRLRGDFDLQTDYQLLEWPAAGINADFAMAAFDNSGSYTGGAGLFLFDNGFGTQISSGFPGITNAFASAPSPSGAVRLTRVGDTLTTSFLSGGAWITLLSGPFTADQAAASIDLFSNVPPFSHPDVKVAYDNFRVNSGTLSCPTWWSDEAPDWQVASRHGDDDGSDH